MVNLGKAKYVHEPDVHNIRAATEVVPLLIKWFDPKSVVDVGCGTGTWLSVFKDEGVRVVYGIDGNYVDRSLLFISEEEFHTADLDHPLDVDQSFDLVISLEVAEHISPHAADTFVASLVSLGDIVVFSAAIPGQGGQNHINEQWHDYWQEKFQKHNFHFYDVLRPIFWNNENVDWWYRQNMFIAIKEGVDHSFKPAQQILRVIHPELLAIVKKEAVYYWRQVKLLEGGKNGNA